MKIKRYINILSVVLVTALLSTSCNDEWKDEIYKQEIGLKSILNDRGVANVYLRYTANGEITYHLPVIVGGSLLPAHDLDVQIAVDNDTLADLNEARWKRRTDLYYKQLEEQYYELPTPSVCHIPAGTCEGGYDIKFKFEGLNLVEKWVLPLTVVDGDNYKGNPRKDYRKAILRIMPFNDYSGSYSATAMDIFLESNDRAFHDEQRTLFVVSENQCFFYAGGIDEELIEREKYKIILTFNEDGSITGSAPDPDIEFQMQGSPRFTTHMKPDDIIPYLEHHYTTLYLEYTYKDVTTYGKDHPISYRVKGSYLMERKINSLIPDNDQAIQW